MIASRNDPRLCVDSEHMVPFSSLPGHVQEAIKQGIFGKNNKWIIHHPSKKFYPDDLKNDDGF